MTIKEVSEKYDLSADTIRYYERIGLIPHVPRKENGIRDFDEAACGWVEFSKCMRSAGVQVEALIEYVDLFFKEGTEEARKDILRRCHYIRPFVAPTVYGKPWQDGNTDDMANDLAYFTFEPDAKWHAFEGYGPGQYLVDPCKLLLTTPGINAESGQYEDFGIHANILATYLRGNGVIPEKCDLNSILFLLTPAENKNKMRFLEK